MALVGFSMTTRHLVPYDDKDTEIWGINDAYKTEGFMKRWDRWFQLHPLNYLAVQDNSPRDLEHLQWLKQNHKFPIYMQEHYPDMPASVKYPLGDVCKKFGRKYLTSSFAFMFGLAALEGFERIELYGFDMKTFSEYANQRPNTEYMIGKAEGWGIDVYIPVGSSLCKGPIYGYEDLDINFRQEMEYMHMGLEATIISQTNEFHKINGQAEILRELMSTYPELKDKAKEMTELAEDKVALINNTLGRKQMTEELTAVFDEMKAKELNFKELKHE